MAEERVQRRLAAILAADMVGYSRLIGADEEGTIARQKAHRAELIDPVIATYGGRIVKTMGDGLLVEFPSVVDAVKCAVAVQQSMYDREADVPEDRRIQYRVGVNLGDIVIDGDDILGDGVNVAARLEGEADTGGICISGDAYRQVLGKIDNTFEDLGERILKNIAAPVRAYRVVLDPLRAAYGDGQLELPDKPSIAVLPFDNMSGDPEQEYFADGIAEDIITALSRIHWFFITARNSSFTYKGRAVDVQQVGRELGVRYILEGSVRKSGQRLRITAQLIDATTGKHVWAERYDRELSDIFEVQDEITRSVVASTQTQVQLLEGSLFEHLEKPSLPIWALVNRAWKLMYELSAESLGEAMRLAEEAISLDPGSARAHQSLASNLFHLAWMGFAEDKLATFARGKKMAERAVRLNDYDEYAHWTLGLLQMASGEYDKGIAELERAIEINPNCSLAYGSLGTVLNQAGRPEEAIINNEIAIRSNPRDPSIFFRYSGLALSHFMLRQFEPALDWARKSVQQKQEWFYGHVLLVASLVELDRLDEARVALSEYLERFPNASLAEIRGISFQNPAHRDQLVGALRKAGLPTGEETEVEAEPLPDRPSIAVLPFDNLSDDSQQEYFSDGLAEDLITDLSKISSLSVAARNSSFSFKGQMPDVKHVADKLGVSFVLEGSVRKMGNRLRINAQLIDGADGRHIWAERYDGNMAEIFEFQDAIREQIVTALEVSLTPTDTALTERKPTESVEAYDLFLKGRANFYSATREHTLEAIKCLEKALEIDPNFADAYGYLSFCQFYGWFHMWPEFDDTLDRAYELAERGVVLDGASAIAVMRLGFTQAWLRRYDQAITNLEKALALAPNNAEVFATFGQALNYGGNPERGLEMVERALSLETFAPPLWEFYAGTSHFLLHRYDEALTGFNRMAERAPKFSPAHFSLAWAYVELGRLDDAHDAIKTALEINSQYTVKEVDRLYPYRLQEVRDRFLDSLRKAGLPEG